MDSTEIAEIVRKASTDALTDYLAMCRLDSPWEVPERFLAIESAKALAKVNLRVAVEFRLDTAAIHPSSAEIAQAPTRLRGAYAHLDLAILKAEPNNPWRRELDGIIEFKKHTSLEDDTNLIEYMVSKKSVRFGLLVLLIVGDTENRVIDEERRLTKAVIEGTIWKRIISEFKPEFTPPLSNSPIKDRYWTISCMLTK